MEYLLKGYAMAMENVFWLHTAVKTLYLKLKKDTETIKGMIWRRLQYLESNKLSSHQRIFFFHRTPKFSWLYRCMYSIHFQRLQDFVFKEKFI